MCTPAWRLSGVRLRCAAARRAGIIVLGGGVPKHHVCNANLMRNGADFAVYVNTAQVHALGGMLASWRGHNEQTPVRSA